MTIEATPVDFIDRGQLIFRRFEWVSLAIAVVTAALVFALSGSGYDLTDEGYYLSSIANYAEFSVSSTQFGFVYHPLYRLAGGDIALLRASSLALTVFLGVWLTHMALSCRLPIAIAVGVTSITVINGWLISPSYNSLVVQAALLGAIGLAISFRDRGSNWGPVLIGLAGWLAFMAKPPSAAALAILTLMCLALGSGHRLRPLVIAVSVASLALLASATIIDGSPFAFIVRLTAAVEDARILQGMGPADGILRIDTWPLQWKDKALLLAVSALLAGAPALTGSGQWQKQKSTLLMIVGGIILAAIAMIIFGSQLWSQVADRQAVWRILPFAAAVGGIVGAIFVKWGTIGKTMCREDWAMMAFLGSLPFVTAFGSNVNYWILGGCASIFWTLAGLRFIVVTSDRVVLMPAILAAQASCLLLIIVWVAQPYRQSEPLFEQQSLVSIGSTTLRISKDAAKYLDTIRSAARREGFRPGDPLLDLTGHAPGVAFALGALPVADPWILGGYVGSQSFARRVVARTPCAIIGRAWLLVEPGGPRAIEPATLGISPSGFRVAARLTGPATDYPAGGAQFLMRPEGKVVDRVAACQRSR